MAAAHRPDGRVTVSMGMAAATGDSADGLRQRADEALYASNARGRNRVTITD